MRELAADIRKEIITLVNTMSKTSYPNTSRLKIFFYNLLTFHEIKDKLVQFKKDYSLATGLNPDELKPAKMEPVMKLISREFFKHLKRRGILIDFSNEKLLLSLIYKKNPRGIEARYNRLLNLITHLFNTPSAYLAICLNIDREKLKRKIGEQFERLSDSLIEKHSWRDKLLKAINYYKANTNLTEVDTDLLITFESFLKLTNAIELLGNDLMPKEKKRKAISNLGEHMVNLSTGILQYKELKERPNAGIIEIISDLMGVLFDILATFRKILSKGDQRAIIHGITEALAPLYVFGVKSTNSDEGKQVELLREKLAKLLKERHKLIGQKAEFATERFPYEGENFWNAILIDRILCKTTQEIFQILGIPVESPSSEFDYEIFFDPENEEQRH